MVTRPLIKARSEFPMLSIKKGPVQEALVAHTVIPQRKVIASVALENGLLFVDKGIVCPPKILSLHTNCLSLRFTLNGLIDRHVPLLVQLCLGDAIGKGRACFNPCGSRLRITEWIVAQAVKKAPALAFFSAH